MCFRQRLLRLSDDVSDAWLGSDALVAGRLLYTFPAGVIYKVSNAVVIWK